MPLARALRGLAPAVPAALLLAVLALAAAADDAEVYQVPSPVLTDIVDAAPTPQVRVGPDQRVLALLQPPSLKPIAELAEPELRLGGLRIKARSNGPSRAWHVALITLVDVADGGSRPLTGVPADARIGNVRFAPGGAHLAFTNAVADGTELWVAEVASGAARRLVGPRLNLAARVTPAWLDAETLVCALVVTDRGPAPSAPAVPAGPVVRENLGTTAPARTYQDLLANPHDEALFSHYLRARVARVALDGTVTALGAPGLLWDLEPSPDGRYLRVETLHRPFSYLVPARRFPRRLEVWDRDGAVVHLVADLPLQDTIPTAFGSVGTGPRELAWRSDAPATLQWVEALDGGDAGREAAERDRLFLLPAPFTGPPRALATLGLRFGGLLWGDDQLALVYEWWWKTRTKRLSRLRPGDPEAAPEVLIERSWEHRYGDPGDPLTVDNAWGRPVLRTGDQGRSLYLIGDGASPEGDRPFLDLFDLETKSSSRLFHSEAPYYERPQLLLDEAGSQLLVRREAVDQPPNYFVRDLGDASTLRPLTDFPHPTPQLLGLEKELITYQRADGVQLSATLYLPPGYDAARDGALPLVLWAYPQEFKSADAAGQVDDSPYRFDRVGWWSSLLWLTRGYAVLDDPAMPIIGEDDQEPNDTFVAQLVSSASAAVDEVVRRGVASPGRIAIGGHSYGAFMTANLLAHSDLFAAGIARSGAYNRTLTPFGFQAEERTVWEAPEVYFAMSPFMHVPKIDEPILLIHGEADNNSGTFPMQSERFYNALKGHGATARLVMLPHESHGYRARESILHMLWETERWLDTYVKNAAPPVVERGAVDQGSR